MARERSVSTVVLDAESGQVLLHLRGDVWLWSLPGGGVEADETWEAAAVREAREETGYEVAVDRLVGEYHRPQLGDTKRVFAAHVVGGAPRLRPPETIRVAWFRTDQLPLNRLPGHREYVQDAVAGAPEPVSTVQVQSWRQQVALRALFALPDVRDLLLKRKRL